MSSEEYKLLEKKENQLVNIEILTSRIYLLRMRLERDLQDLNSISDELDKYRSAVKRSTDFAGFENILDNISG